MHLFNTQSTALVHQPFRSDDLCSELSYYREVEIIVRELFIQTFEVRFKQCSQIN
jgi:hypothetical protein